eukprot:CFRG6627T1
MKISAVSLIAVACMVSSSYAMDPTCSKVKINGSIGSGCRFSMLTATVPTNGKCVAVSVGSVKVNMKEDEAVGSAYKNSDCSGDPYATVKVREENTCYNAGMGSFKMYCVE